MRLIGGYSGIMFSGVGMLRRTVFGGRTGYMWENRNDRCGNTEARNAEHR
jgi:hypothetical protein